MANVEVRSTNPISEQQRAQILQFLQDNMSDQELLRLGQIAKSAKALKYLNDKYAQVKFFFGIK